MLSWMPPTTNTDDSTLNDLAGYNIYYGNSPGVYFKVIPVFNTGISDYLVKYLPNGSWYFTVSAFDGSGNESAKSNEVSKTITINSLSR